MNIAVITGASSGLGLESAKQIDSIYTYKLDEIWLISRRIGKMEALAADLKHKVRIFAIDVSDKNALNEYNTSLKELSPNILMLVNAAGCGYYGNFCDNTIEDINSTIDTNCNGLVNITYISIPYVVSGGRIIQFASASAFMPQQSFAVYAASKSFVLSFSRALNEELKSRNISVTVACPGPVKTEFMNLASKYKKASLMKTLVAAKPSSTVHTIIYDSYKRKAVSVPTGTMKVIRLISKLFSHSLLLNLLSKVKKK